MAFLGKGSKVDLQYMATEMEVEDVLGLKVMELRRAIVNKKRIELKEGNEAEVKGPGQIKIDLHKLIPKFDSKFDDISLFLISFERQAKILNLPKICWVTHLISILPSEIVGLIAREPEKDAADYEFVKKLLLQRFKLSPEKFRQLFVKHQKNPDGTWKDFYYEIRNFCEEWLNGLDIQTFEDLKVLLITDQMKKVPSEVREHFLDDWAKIKTPRVLVEKLDEYEDVHGKTKRPAVPFFIRRNHIVEPCL
ncbi:CCHC-type domain-containing protein [Trichonephila clavipes]|nr:CCHC-type domain-containing protein [Trichonephila clavipes]